MFGRLPLFFPNLFLPQWQIEGLATYEESALTGAGRVPAGDFRHAARSRRGRRPLPAARSGERRPDRLAVRHVRLSVRRVLPSVPRHRYGAEKIKALADATAGRVPYIGTPAFKKVFGRSLGELWSDFEADTRAHAAAESTAARA